MNQQELARELADKLAEADTTPIVEQIARLEDAFVRYVAHMHDACPFQLGDLVTPLPNGFIAGVGLPHKVLEIIEDPDPQWADVHAGTMRDGAVPNMRVGIWRKGAMATFWVESWLFELWNEEQATGEME